MPTHIAFRLPLPFNSLVWTYAFLCKIISFLCPVQMNVAPFRMKLIE